MSIIEKITKREVENSIYYVVYTPDNSKNFFIEIEKTWQHSLDKLLDHVMMLEDGDLANYEIFLRII